MLHSDFLERDVTGRRVGDGERCVSASSLSGVGAEVFLGTKKKTPIFQERKY